MFRVFWGVQCFNCFCVVCVLFECFLNNTSQSSSWNYIEDCVARPCYYLIWIQQSPACYLDPLPPESLRPSAFLWGSTTTTFSNLYETTPVLLNIHFPGSLYLPPSALWQRVLLVGHTKAPCCSLGLCGLGPSCRSLTSPFPPQVTVEPCRAAAHLSAASGDWSMTTSLLTGRGHACHDRYLLTEDRAENCTENNQKVKVWKGWVMKVFSGYQCCLCLLFPSRLLSSSVSQRRPPKLLFMFGGGVRLWRVHSSLQTESSETPLSEGMKDVRRGAGRKVGGRARLKTPDLAGCYFLWAVVSTGEDVIAHLTRIVSSRRSPATARNGNLRG